MVFRGSILINKMKKYNKFEFRICKKCGKHIGTHNKSKLCISCSRRKIIKDKLSQQKAVEE